MTSYYNLSDNPAFLSCHYGCALEFINTKMTFQRKVDATLINNQKVLFVSITDSAVLSDMTAISKVLDLVRLDS